MPSVEAAQRFAVDVLEDARQTEREPGLAIRAWGGSDGSVWMGVDLGDGRCAEGEVRFLEGVPKVAILADLLGGLIRRSKLAGRYDAD